MFYLVTSSPILADIVPDATLPNNSSVKSVSDTETISGGTQAGGNLFHSFEQFSVPTGSRAFFNNSLAIQNIITRVTGSSESKIDGTIEANGAANLFVLNPNGIVFGPNARLNIGGSFVGSTASSIRFADGTQFSAKTPTTPLLTVNVPIGLNLGSNPGAIRVQGVGHDLKGSGSSPGTAPILGGDSSKNGLQVKASQTLALVGGDVNLEGGILTARGGRIQLGSVESGIVSLNSTSSGISVGYPELSSFRDIQMSQRSLADASGTTTGSIELQGRNVSLRDGSVIFLQNQGSLPAGAIEVKASESLAVSGTDPVAKVIGGFGNETLGFGDGGDISISTPKLRLQDGGTLVTRTFGQARAGNIAVWKRIKFM